MRDRRAPFDILACLSLQNARTDVRHERRTLDLHQLAAFLAAARTGRPFRELDDLARAVLYPLSARTGLRASELASLTPASFDFEARKGTVEAGYSKRRRRDVLDLRADLVQLVRVFAKGKPAEAPSGQGPGPRPPPK
jgi:integrase